MVYNYKRERKQVHRKVKFYATLYISTFFLTCTFGWSSNFYSKTYFLQLIISGLVWSCCQQTFSTWETYYQLSRMALVKIRKQRLAADTESHVLCVASVRGWGIVSGHCTVCISLSSIIWTELTRSIVQSRHSPVQFNVCLWCVCMCVCVPSARWNISDTAEA